MRDVKIRQALEVDREELATLRALLWPDGSTEHHRAELDSFFAGAFSVLFPYVILVAELEDVGLVGFAEVTLRSRADGCDPARPVGYLEGWYVAPEYRKNRIGGRLVDAFEMWAREQGCTEVASDTWLENEESQRAHQRLGFEVVDRCVNYRKRL